MSGETYNAICGYTSDPYNKALSSGGSSGVGADLEGSDRVPASLRDLYALRPSSGHFLASHIRDGMQGQEVVRRVAGPMARSLAAIEMWTEWF
ncbi:amidase signature domain-containing protein [Aspergillus varians]